MPLDALSAAVRRTVSGFPAGRWLAAELMVGCLFSAPVLAEPPASSVQWGGLAFPDQTPTRSVGETAGRFAGSEIPRNAVHYDSSLNESFGLNLISFRWTKRWDCSFCQGLTTDVSAGIGLLPEEPGRYSIDGRHFYRVPPAPLRRPGVGDGMVNAPAPGLFSFYRKVDGRTAFGSNFIRPGATLSKDLFGRSAVRRLAIPLDADLPEQFALMGRITLREQFWSLSYRYEHLKVESWTLQNSRDTGPDYGIALAYNVEWYSTSLLNVTSVWNWTPWSR